MFLAIKPAYITATCTQDSTEENKPEFETPMYHATTLPSSSVDHLTKEPENANTIDIIKITINAYTLSKGFRSKLDK